jgi:prevent-host-death family protein
MQRLSKSQFKPRALEIMRTVEQTGESILITDHGKEVLELKPHTPSDTDPLQQLKDSVVRLQGPFTPVDEDEWEAAN